MGDRKRAMQSLEEAYENDDVWLMWAGVDPRLAPLRSESAFRMLLRAAGLPAVSVAPAAL
jgi:hypothetical protein